MTTDSRSTAFCVSSKTTAVFKTFFSFLLSTNLGSGGSSLKRLSVVKLDVNKDDESDFAPVPKGSTIVPSVGSLSPKELSVKFNSNPTIRLKATPSGRAPSVSSSNSDCEGTYQELAGINNSSLPGSLSVRKLPTSSV